MANAQYAILRFAKYKGPTLSRIEAHNERTTSYSPTQSPVQYHRPSKA